MPASFFWQNIHSPSRFPVLSWAEQARYIVICINPAFTKTVDRTDKPKIPSKFAIRTAQYNEFRCNQFCDTAPLNAGGIWLRK